MQRRAAEANIFQGVMEGPKMEKARRGRRMRQALNLIDNWEEEDVVDPDPTTLGGGVRRSMSNI
jgi:hypothetical protein